jgi:hypothetical protein
LVDFFKNSAFFDDVGIVLLFVLVVIILVFHFGLIDVRLVIRMNFTLFLFFLVFLILLEVVLPMHWYSDLEEINRSLMRILEVYALLAAISKVFSVFLLINGVFFL